MPYTSHNLLDLHKLFKKISSVKLKNNTYMHCLSRQKLEMNSWNSKSRKFLIFFSLFDIVFSIAIIVIMSLHIAKCKVEDGMTITENITPEQLEFFYKALEECGYKEVANIPSSETVCSIVEIRIIPVASIAIALDFLLAVLIQIMVLDKQFFLDKTINMYTIPVSFICIPFGTLLSMSLAWIAIAKLTDRPLCWLAFSISEQRESLAHFLATKIVPVILAIYKPLELGTFYIYGSNFFQESSSSS